MEFLHPKFNCGSDLRFACDDCKKEECGRLGFQNCDCCRPNNDPDTKRCPEANGEEICDCGCHIHPLPKTLKRAKVRSNMTVLEALNIFDLKVVEKYITTFSKISEYLQELYDLYKNTKQEKEKEIYIKLCKRYIRFCIRKYNLKDFPMKTFMKHLKDISLWTIPFYPTKNRILTFK